LEINFRTGRNVLSSWRSTHQRPRKKRAKFLTEILFVLDKARQACKL
jgi:hypothetical protein